MPLDPFNVTRYTFNIHGIVNFKETCVLPVRQETVHAPPPVLQVRITASTWWWT